MIKVTLFMIYLFYLDLTFSSCFDILKISFNTQPYIIFNHILAILALCISILIINVLKNASKLHKIIQKKHMIYKYYYLLTHKEIGLNYFIIGTFRKLFYVSVLLLLYSSY